MKVYFANVLKNCELLEKIFDFDEIWNSKQWTLNFTLIWEKKGCSSLIPLFLRGSGISVYCSFWTYCFYKSDMQDLEYYGILEQKPQNLKFSGKVKSSAYKKNFFLIYFENNGKSMSISNFRYLCSINLWKLQPLRCVLKKDCS